MSELYDPSGPLRPNELSREHAPDEGWDAAVGGTRVSRRLTPQRLARILRSLNEGDGYEYLTLAEELEENDLHFRSVLFTRKVMLTSASRMVVAASESDEHRAHKTVVEQLVVEDAFTGLVFDMADGLSKGFSAVEIIWNTRHPGAARWRPSNYVWRDPRRFSVNPISGGSLRLRDKTREGKALPPGQYVVHRPRLKSGKALRAGLAYPAAIAYALKNFTIRDLMRFIEVMGIPARVGTLEDESPQKKKELLRALVQLSGGTSAVIPEGAKIDFIQSAKSGGDIFLGTAKYWDSQLSKLVLGQTMTTDDGASKSQAGVHNLVRHDIAQHDAGAMSADINRCLIRPFIDMNFGPPSDGLYPRLELTVREKENMSALVKAMCSLADRNVAITEREAREVLGLTAPEDGEKLMQPLSVIQLTDKPGDSEAGDDAPPEDTENTPLQDAEDENA